MDDYVHIHYKWFRFDFTIDEFLEFSDYSTSSERLKKVQSHRFQKNCTMILVRREKLIKNQTFWIDKGDNSDFKNSLKQFM